MYDANLAIQEFKQGLEFLRNSYPAKAIPHLRRAVELNRENPYFLSYLGLAVVRASQKYAEAEFLCESALDLKRDDERLYLNLAEVYSEASRREDAIDTLKVGMERVGNDSLLLRAMGRLQRRRTPIFPFLSRSHFLNRSLGRLRHIVLDFCLQHWQPA